MTYKKVILSHSGRQHSYYVARNLKALGLLKTFFTSSYVKNRLLQDLFTRTNNNFFSKRYLSGLVGEEVCSNWKYEIPEFVARIFKVNASRVSQLVFRRDERFDNFVAKKLKEVEFDLFWGFQGSCLNSLIVANYLNKISSVEMTMAYVPFAKKLLSEESKLHPEWADSIDIISFPPLYESRLEEEPYLASKVFAASEFLKTTLVDNGIDSNKIEVLPLGFDISSVSFVEDHKNIENRPLKLLYVGRITQGKGIKYMLDAMSGLNSKDIELHIIGNVIGSGKEFYRHKSLYEYYGSMSQRQLFDFYKSFDALLFPSLMEGFPLAVIEAMGAGLPVITTPNTSAEELIVEGETGFIVPIRDSLAIERAIETLRELKNDQFQTLRLNARRKALDFTWDSHMKRVEKLINNL